MRRIRIAQQALRLTAEPSRQQHICQTCLAQAARRIHTSVPRNADLPFFKNLRDSIFGSKKANVTEQNRGETGAEPGSDRKKKNSVRVVKGRTYQVAPKAPGAADEYVSVSSWDGLEHVGSTAWVEKQAVKGAKPYVGFLGKNPRIMTDLQWRELLQSVAFEVRNLAPFKSSGQTPIHDKGVHPRDTPTEANAQSISQPEQPVGAQSKSPEERILGSQDPTNENDSSPWMSMRLTDPKIKFEVVTRVMQLTNRRIPDHVISRASTMAGLYNSLKVKEQPKRLFDAEEIKELRTSPKASNVTIYPTRRTPVHKEKQVGRWKVIEEELKSRDLPVLGSRHRGVKERLISI